MTRSLFRRQLLPHLERGREPCRLHGEVMIRAYALVAPVRRRALPPADAPQAQGPQRQACSGAEGAAA